MMQSMCHQHRRCQQQTKKDSAPNRASGNKTLHGLRTASMYGNSNVHAVFIYTTNEKREKKARKRKTNECRLIFSAHIVHTMHVFSFSRNKLFTVNRERSRAFFPGAFFCLFCLCFSGFRAYFDEKNCVGSDRYQRRDTPKRKSSAAATMKKTQRKEQYKEHKERIQKGKNLL